MAQINHPRHPNQLAGTKWTAVLPRLGYRHFEVETVSTKTGVAVLRPVLDRSESLTIEWRELRDRDAWQPGWLEDIVE